MQTDAGFGGMGGVRHIPSWVPQGALHYIEHTEHGQPIRALARAACCHASTIVRQIRKLETRRDDPLVDEAIRNLGKVSSMKDKDTFPAGDVTEVDPQDGGVGIPDDDTMTKEAMRILRRLAETGAVLAVAHDLAKAVVVRDIQGGATTRTAVVDTSVAQAMALKDWIAPVSSGRITRYQMTSFGRTALAEFFSNSDLLDDSESESNRETAAGYGMSQGIRTRTEGRSRYGAGESPLCALARRRDRSGKHFLSDNLVQAGERLREDFELAEMATSEALDWEHFLASNASSAKVVVSEANPNESGPAVARQRVQAALQNLGPGLSDVALHCCCYLEGLETTEKRLGWSARSGKIVLRIALMRLRRHYDETLGRGGGLIG